MRTMADFRTLPSRRRIKLAIFRHCPRDAAVVCGFRVVAKIRAGWNRPRLVIWAWASTKLIHGGSRLSRAWRVAARARGAGRARSAVGARPPCHPADALSLPVACGHALGLAAAPRLTIDDHLGGRRYLAARTRNIEILTHHPIGVKAAQAPLQIRLNIPIAWSTMHAWSYSALNALGPARNAAWSSTIAHQMRCVPSAMDIGVLRASQRPAAAAKLLRHRARASSMPSGSWVWAGLPRHTIIHFAGARAPRACGRQPYRGAAIVPRNTIGRLVFSTESPISASSSALPFERDFTLIGTQPG